MPPPLKFVAEIDEVNSLLLADAVTDSCAALATVIGCAIDGNVENVKDVKFALMNNTHGRELPHDGRSSGCLPAVACETELPFPVWSYHVGT